MISLKNNWRRELKKILNEYKSMPTINTSVAKKENPSINQRKGQIGWVSVWWRNSKTSEFSTSVHPSDWFVRKPFICAKPINHIAARCCYPSLLFIVRPLFLFLILHRIQAHTYRYRNYLSHNNTYHINRKDACTNNHGILLHWWHYAMKH